MGEIQIGGVRLIGLSCDTRARETETFGECEAIGVTDERIHKQPDELPPSRVKFNWASLSSQAAHSTAQLPPDGGQACASRQPSGIC